jgi:hypothetical protein
MNIFATSDDPVACALALDDKRINKMIVEACQMLSTALHLSGRGSPQIYQSAYSRHPVVLWTASDPRNYAWLYRHLEALLAERTFRTDRLEHRSRRLLPMLSRFVETETPPAAFQNCTPHKEIDDVHRAYRVTLCKKGQRDRRPAMWTRRGPPTFFRNPAG